MFLDGEDDTMTPAMPAEGTEATEATETPADETAAM